MPLTDERLHEIVNQLMSRPGHETVRTRIDELLIHGLGATATDISYERPLPEVHGRLDGLLGRTVFEYKSDLRKERADAEEELTRYLSDRESNSGEHFIGIATDGAQFITYELRDGAIRELQFYVPSRDAPRDLLSWLSAAVVIEAEIPPDPDIVKRELGRASLAFNIARVRLSDLWESVAEEPEVLSLRI
ncbi:MAG: hypothetical protein IIC85_06950, partial [Chloroflexi bacterium]|nr:hypothetical protein [Chloroflexota bacterium]